MVKRPFNTPPAFYTRKKSMAINAQFVSPLRHREGRSIMRQISAISTIVLLFFSSSPFAIFRKIASIVVNSLDGKPFGAFSHVLKKIDEGMPPLANGNTPAAIAGITRHRFIKASRFHGVPRCVSSGLVHSVRLRVSVAVSIASAGCCIARLKVGRVYSDFSAALTQAVPEYFRLPVSYAGVCLIDYGEAAKLNASSVNEIAHNRTLTQERG